MWIKTQGNPLSASRALWVEPKNPIAMPNKNEQDSHWWLLPYDTN